MSAFKVGQRVRIVIADAHPEVIGMQATITSGLKGGGLFCDAQHDIDIDGLPPPRLAVTWCAPPFTLAPLSDPKADAFIERIKKLKPYDEPRVLTPSDLERVRGGA